MSQAEQHEYYRALIEANGGRMNPDGPTVLGLRGLGADGARHDGRSNLSRYDDTFVVLGTGANGEPSVNTFSGSTRANQRRSGAAHGQDAQGRSVSGVAMLAPGSYDVAFSSSNYQGQWGSSYHVRTLDGADRVPAYRDTNSDGVISESERSTAEQRGVTATSILFHSGKRDTPSSIGCQTLHPTVYNQFADLIGRRGFQYTLLDANNSFQ